MYTTSISHFQLISHLAMYIVNNARKVKEFRQNDTHLSGHTQSSHAFGLKFETVATSSLVQLDELIMLT